MKRYFTPAITRSPLSDFYGREIEDSIANHPEWYLKEIRDEGFDSVWLHCILREVVSSSPFPEFGNKDKLDCLKKFVEYTSKFGIKVYLYLCEPRGLVEKDKFWEKHPDVKGQPHIWVGTDFSGKYYALCSSTQKVRDFLYESCYNLFKDVSGLGGIFCITASEFHTHCYSHFPKWKKEVKNFPEMIEWARQGFYCKRCEKRQPYEVVSEIITLINKGVKDANKNADVIAWSWSWNIIEPQPQKNLINSLPEDVILMGDFERGGYKFMKGKRYPVDEYSLSYIGPSPRFKQVIVLAKNRGMRTMAKLQMSTTHEIVTIPYIPAIHNFAEKLDRMRKMKIDGFLSCWIFGGNISPMSKIAGKFSTSEKSKKEIIKEVAISEFGNSAYKKVINGWKKFSIAFSNYPFSVPFTYNGPINYAVVYPLSIDAKKVDAIPSWRPLPRDEKGHLKVGDNLETFLDIPYETFCYQMEKLTKKWKEGLKILEQGMKKEDNKRLKREIDLANYVYLSFRSSLNIVSFYVNLREYKKGKKEETIKIKKVLEDELEITKSAYEIFKRNPDFGYHPEAYENFLNEDDFKYKISLIQSQLKGLNKIEK